MKEDLEKGSDRTLDKKSGDVLFGKQQFEKKIGFCSRILAALAQPKGCEQNARRMKIREPPAITRTVSCLPPLAGRFVG
jgi:hypothetical protein